jgi:diguanylate cyclase (GGDEF)-like protein
MPSWEHAAARVLNALRLDSVRSKILIFALLATLIPALSTAVLSYVQNKRALTEKLHEELVGISSQAAREIDLWVKERFLDARVFTSSFEVTENLERVGRPGGSARLESVSRINDYLRSVQARFPYYAELAVLDRSGRVVTTGGGESADTDRTGDWPYEVERRTETLGDPFWDDALAQAVVMMAVPIEAAEGGLLGILTAKVSLDSLHATLQRFTPGASGQAHLITATGDLITSSRANSPEIMASTLDPDVVEMLRVSGSTPVTYRDQAAVPVVGTSQLASRAGWSVIAELPSAEAYQQVTRLRNFAFILVVVLLVVVGAIAYVLGLLIVRPLNRLAQGASRVAGGDLSVDLPVVSGGEVGYLTEVFNDMVARLRHGRDELDSASEALRAKNEELERLSVTDGLTGLYNRRHLMKTLDAEQGRATRYGRPYAILMIDVDHFKKFNDKHGHLAGDDVLAAVGSITKQASRSVDCPARYGGEEFAILLSESDLDGAVEVGQRVCELLAERSFEGSKITVSIGAAEYPADGDTPEAVIASADAALYRAKRQGRNRVARATRKPTKKSTKKS